jgi:hypothetical protein
MRIREKVRRCLGRDRKQPARPPEEGATTTTVTSPDPPSQLSPETAAGDCLKATSHPQHPSTIIIDSQSDPSKSLWDEAYEQLVDETPDLVKALENDLLQLQNQQPGTKAATTERRLQRLVQQRLSDIEASRLGFTVGGKRLLVREQAGKIVHAIISVKDVISAAVVAEPHAALAWAGVLVFLNVGSCSRSCLPAGENYADLLPADNEHHHPG